MRIRMRIQKLDFDSHLFGYPVGKCLITQPETIASIVEFFKAFQLVYVFSPIPLQVKSNFLLKVDEKVIFEKKVESNISTVVKPAICTQWNEHLLQLALESGTYSRFKMDSRLNKQEFEKLYSFWIRQEFEKGQILEPANRQGFVSVSIQDKKASIGLIAVNPSCRRMGIGKALINFALDFAKYHACESITVSTQASNHAACKLYEGMGFTVVESTFVYHYWRG